MVDVADRRFDTRKLRHGRPAQVQGLLVLIGRLLPSGQRKLYSDALRLKRPLS